MRTTLGDIARLVGGELRGDASKSITGAATLTEATESDISFIGNLKYLSQLKTTRAGALFLSPDIKDVSRDHIVLKNPVYGWAKILEVIEAEKTPRPAPGVHPSAVVAKSARLGKDVSIGPLTVIEDNAVIGDRTVILAQGYIGRNAVIGEDCFFYAQVVVREGVAIGKRCLFQPGVVLGSDGYGFTWHDNRHYKVPQAGGLVIEDDVEVQANSTIDRGAVGDTRIGAGTKIDNLVQIAHNVEMGKHCLIVAQTGIAGSVKIGNGVTLAAQVGVAGHITLGDRVVVGAKGGASHDLKAGAVVWGVPAQPLKDELKMQATMRRLPKLFDEWNAMKKKLGLS
jgi:UDP-3-O-[3-hydroxymyristoyl] glucosamine N-acyltransferase